jgi:pentatricopeptide repeat protein
VECGERILGKMKKKGIAPDILTSITLVHMYSMAGDLEKAKDAFEFLRKEGFTMVQ